jgi:molybdopterin/thiamine biosynthesis adenylyltransferase
MSGSISSTWNRILTKPVRSADSYEPAATDRQERIPGFDQARFSSTCTVLIGAGGLNSEVGEGLVRKGIGCLKIFDPDRVELSNLNRQRFFGKDLGENKAWALVRNLAPEAIGETLLQGCRLSFQDAVEGKLDSVCHVAVCGVDNNRTRIFVSEHFACLRLPLVILGVSNDGSHGYVFVQEVGGACFGCLFPDAVENLREPCPAMPAVKDILKVVAGIALYAVDSLLMDRKRSWHYKQIFLDGSLGERSFRVERRPACALCMRTLDRTSRRGIA